jgi:2-oxoisovalerate dehydrogenase E1 component
MGGHATHDEAEARRTFPAALFEEWGRREPIALFEAYLTTRDVARDTLAAIEQEVEQEVEQAEQQALESREHRMPDGAQALRDVYALATPNGGNGS